MELLNVSNISSTPNLHHNQVSRQSQTLFPVIIDSVPRIWLLTMRSGLNALGRAMGTEVDEQNQHIDRIINKTDKVSFNLLSSTAKECRLLTTCAKVDDQIAMNRARLDRIH
jgi:hypothetical protein